MKYLKIYKRIIEKSRTQPRIDGEYYEKHHILPISIFDEVVNNLEFNWLGITDVDSDDNIVKLLPREHYIVHMLLVKIFRINKNCYEKMLFAANLMSCRTKNSRKYSWLKKQHSLLMTATLTGKPSRAKGCKWSESRRQLGLPWLSGKTYEEIHGEKRGKLLREIRRNGRIGKKHTPETISKLSNMVKTDIWRERISKSKKGVPISEESKRKIKKYFGNPLLNPNIDRTLYKFYHKDGRIVTSTKYDMIKNYECTTIYLVIRGERTHSKGWEFRGEIITTLDK